MESSIEEFPTDVAYYNTPILHVIITLQSYTGIKHYSMTSETTPV